MHTTRLAAFALGAMLGSLALPACDLDVSDLNNPPLSDLENNPTAVTVGAACTGLLIGNRSNTAAANGYVSQLGILGRESYNFDQADPRYIGELLQGQLNPGSPFGGNFWAMPYRNLQLASVILRVLPRVPSGELDDAARAAIRGFVQTIQALDLLQVIVTHDTNGAVIDTDREITDPLAPIVDRDIAYAEITRLLDAADTELSAASEGGFPFAIPGGYNGFNTPATFLTFNRAIRARVAAYEARFDPANPNVSKYQEVLTALMGSFLDGDTTNGRVPDFDRGVYHTYSTSNGDVTNGLINPNIFAHPSAQTDAQNKADGKADNRFMRKIRIVPDEDAGSAQGKTSTLRFDLLYPGPEAPVPVIRNEELILLRAEARFFTGDVAGAVADLNLVHMGSGGLPALTNTAPTPMEFVDALLYERRYSLMFEGGHRWIDLRRFGRPLPLDPVADGEDPDVANVRYPIPLPECNARPGEQKCTLGST